MYEHIAHLKQLVAAQLNQFSAALTELTATPTHLVTIESMYGCTKPAALNQLATALNQLAAALNQLAAALNQLVAALN